MTQTFRSPLYQRQFYCADIIFVNASGVIMRKQIPVIPSNAPLSDINAQIKKGIQTWDEFNTICKNLKIPDA